MNSRLKIWLVIRIIFGLIAVLIEVSSVLEGDWGTAFIAMFFCLFLTDSPATIKDKLKLSYGLVFIVCLLTFGVVSNKTMDYFYQINQVN